MFIYLFMYLFIYLFIYLVIYLFICLYPYALYSVSILRCKWIHCALLQCAVCAMFSPPFAQEFLFDGSSSPVIGVYMVYHSAKYSGFRPLKKHRIVRI